MSKTSTAKSLLMMIWKLAGSTHICQGFSDVAAEMEEYGTDGGPRKSMSA